MSHQQSRFFLKNRLVYTMGGYVLSIAIAASVVPAALGEPGNKIYVRIETSVHTLPGKEHPVLMRLEEGHPLVEIERVHPGSNHILGRDFKYTVVEIPEESGSWVNAGIVGTGGKDGWAPTSAVGDTGLAVPLYDIQSYCEEVAGATGGSYTIEKGCRQMEAAAKASVEGRMVEPRIMKYCNEVASTSGGSYSILDSCITMEQESRDSMNSN